MLTYRTIKEDVEGVLGRLKNYRAMNSEEDYYAIRDLDRGSKFARLTGAEKAARLIFLNKTCFNGLYRVNSRGLFNVPYGGYKNPAICEENVLRRISAYLNSNQIAILNIDFEQAALAAEKDSFVYFDPPYHSPDKTNFTGYQAEGFGDGEQERLRDLMIKMTKRGIKCLLSNSDTGFIRDLYNYDFFTILTVQAKRPINSNPSGRGAVNEVLILNWKGGAAVRGGESGPL
jgi:DNA adenine methylase